MLANRVREHNKTGQTMKKIGNKHNERSRFKKSQYEKPCFVPVFFVAAPKSRAVYIGARSTIHLAGPHNKYPTLIPCIFIPTNETWMQF